MTAPSIEVEELMQHTQWLRGLARGLVKGEDAEDVAQETMVSALQSLPPANKPLRPWLARVATNVVRMNYRSASRRQLREIAFADNVAESKRNDVVRRFEVHSTIAEIMVELPEPYRSTLLHRYFDEQSSAEIAAAEGIAAGTVRWRIKRGLEILRERLDEQGGGRSTWMFALQPMIGLPTNALSAGGTSTATILAKVAIGMKIAKIVTVAVVASGLFYGVFAVTRDEPEAKPLAAAHADANGAKATRKAVATPKRDEESTLKPALTKVQKKRKALMVAISAARDRREERAKKTTARPIRSTTSEAPALLGSLEPEYIRSQIREILPLVRDCFERSLLRRPELEGTAVVKFTIVGEEEVGGIVELSEFDHEASTIKDEQLSECIQETMYAAEFEPPEGGGRVEVTYPFTFLTEPEE